MSVNTLVGRVSPGLPGGMGVCALAFCAFVVLFFLLLVVFFVGFVCLRVWVFVCMQSTVDKLIKKTNLALVVGSSSWREQFVNAVTVSAGNTHTNNTTNSHTHTTLIAFGIGFFFGLL